MKYRRLHDGDYIYGYESADKRIQIEYDGGKDFILLNVLSEDLKQIVFSNHYASLKAAKAAAEAHI